MSKFLTEFVLIEKERTRAPRRFHNHSSFLIPH